MWLCHILPSISLPISSIWCVQCPVEKNRQRDSVERHGQYRGDLITRWKASFRQQVLSGCVVKGLLGGLTVLVEVEALVCCSTGKLQDKDGALPNPCSAAKQKRKLLLYQNYKAFCLSVFVRVCVDLCNFFFLCSCVHTVPRKWFIQYLMKWQPSC